MIPFSCNCNCNSYDVIRPKITGHTQTKNENEKKNTTDQAIKLSNY